MLKINFLGPFKCSSTTLDAEQKLFLELKSARNELSLKQAKSDELKKVLKCLLMRNPYDLRGARRLSSILELYKVNTEFHSVWCKLQRGLSFTFLNNFSLSDIYNHKSTNK